MAKVLQTEHPHAQRDPAICGSDPVVAGTRIPIRLLYLRARSGDTVDSIQQACPRLTLAQSHDALNYAYDHLSEIEKEIQQEQANSC